MNSFINNSWVMWITFFIGLILQIMPLPEAIYFLKPNWLMLIILFWIINILEKVQITRAFFMGLIYDLFSGANLGTYAFVYTFIAYIVSYKAQIIKNLALWQQAFVIVFLSLIYNFLLFAIQVVTYHMITLSPLLFLSAFTDGIVWIFLFLILKIIQTIFDVN